MGGLQGDGPADAAFQHPNVYNSQLPDPAGHHADSLRYLAEIKAGLAGAVLRQDHNQAVVWVINLHKYIILYGLKFTRTDHIYLIRVVFGLLTTQHVDPHILDKHAKVLSALLKKKYLIPRTELQLDWRPLFQLFQSWEDSSPAVRGLLKAPAGFKAQVKAVVKVSRGYFTDSSTAEMLSAWSHMLCPADRAMATAVRYLSLFLPTTKDIPPEVSWRLWLPLLSSFWQTWGNSPVWEVDLLRLYSRLAFHRVGQVPWDPLMPDLYTRFMASFNLPVTYGGSGVHIKHGISGSGCIGSITKWIVSTLGGGGPSQAHLETLLTALQSYYHPANSNGSSELLHVFISCLCTYLVDRVHLERYNKKWETKVPPDKRLTDRDIEAFVLAVKPIAFLVLYNNFEDEARAVFQSLALLAPATIIPPLLERLEAAKDTLTEPHRFHVCVQAMSATSGPLIRNYPGRALGLLHSLLPGIDVNDIWKCTDIFVLMSDLLDNIPLTDISRTGGGRVDSEERATLAGQTANFESFVVEFMNRCFTLIENSVRVNIRSDGGNTDEYLNDEEIAADAAINDTFLRMCVNSSPDIFQVIFSKLRSYLSGKIVEPTVAGGILASMCKSVVQCDPAKGLDFFVPYLVRALTERVGERGSKQEEEGKVDEELQFNLQLLGEVLSVRNVAVYRTTGAHVLPFVEPLCSVLDCTLELGQRDEYELAHSVLGGVLSWLAHPRLLETGPRLRPELGQWGAMVGLEELAVAWYRPGPQELAVVTGLLERYLLPAMETLGQFAAGELELEKEELQRGLKLVCRVLAGVSELAEPEQEAAWESCLSSGLAWLAEVRLELPGGRGGIRREVGRLVCRVQDKMDADLSDDTDSYAAIVSVFDTLLFCYGADEDEIGDHLEDHKREKLHREDKLVRGKRHLPGVHLERVTLQWETHVWLRNLLVLESLPRATLQHIFALCIHHYSEVRVVAQELFLKLVGRVGKACHPLVIPQLVTCLKEGAADDVLKGALYMINSEKHMFFYSWEAASQIWPALVTATHSDKQSVDDLLRDIGIKANRYYQDYVLYTMPVSAPGPPPGLLELVRGRPEGRGPEGGLASTGALAGQLHYQALETALVSLVEGKALHWRHQEMAVGMLLSMVAYDTAPSQRTASLWLGLLLSDQRTIRLMAYQALEGILKLVKLRSRKAPLAELVSDLAAGGGRPGLRPDNQLLQYRDSMDRDELEAYWARPFVVKSYTGYHGWPQDGKARLCHTAADFQHSPGSVLGLVADFFLDEANTDRFVELNSLEHDKGSDFFSTDRGLFLSFLLENLGPRLATAFQPHIERLVGSPEESQQRAAAEMIYGVVRGSRFWDFGATGDTWAWLLPVFQQVLTSVTAETQSDWDFCFSGVSNKADPNRLRPLFELLVTPENLMSQGAFKESSYLLFVAKCLNMNWRVRGLYCRTYNILREHWAHPFTNVRHQIASTLATLTIMNSPWAGEEGGTLGEGFPTKQLFIREVIPHLSLNSHNPEFSSLSREVSPNTSSGSSEDVSMDTVEGRGDQAGEEAEEKEDSETKRANRTLEMVSLWICHQIRLSSASLDPALFELLPYLCQFIGTETDQDVSQACLQALCYLSACVLPAAAIQPMLDMVGRIARSESYKTKMSVLEFLQVAVFTNFPALVHGAGYRPQVTHLVLSLLQDPHITVRQKAAKILGGLLHSGFLQGDAVTSLLADLRRRVRPRMARTGRRFRKERPAGPANTTNADTIDNLAHHSGILGLCAFVEAFPYDVPVFLPPILMELSTHLNDPQPTPLTIKKSLQEFKRTHQDNWQEHKTKFTEDQLVVMTDLLVSQNYYA